VLDAAAIAAIVVLNAVLGFAQEANAERAVRALREGVRPHATVRRSGREVEVPESDSLSQGATQARTARRLLQRVLGFGSYETAWAWMHKLRRAMVRPDRDLLTGVVEVDETFVGGVSVGRPGAASTKSIVRVAVERVGSKRLGRVRLELGDAPNTLGLVHFATATVTPGSTIRTDGAKVLRRLSDLGYTHEFTTGYNAEDPNEVLPGVHLVASLLKRWLIGTLHYGIAEEHLPYYLDEFTFRFNRRTATRRGLLFYRLLQQAVDTEPHPLSTLLHPETREH